MEEESPQKRRWGLLLLQIALAEDAAGGKTYGD